jgi:hypothetical protein
MVIGEYAFIPSDLPILTQCGSVQPYRTSLITDDHAVFASAKL